MIPTQPESWKHHFVPRSLLRYFCPEVGGEYLQVFNKQTGRSFLTSLMNAGSEKGFNAYKEGEKTVNFESDFDAVDKLLATRLREIHQVRSVSELCEATRQDWVDLVAVQIVRTPITRSTLIALAEHINRQGMEKCGMPAVDIPSKDDVAKAARKQFRQREKYRVLLAAKDIVLLRPPEGGTFRISDRPVMKCATLPYGDAGLGSLGVAIYMPIGQQLMLGMICPSVRRKLSKLDIDQLGLSDAVAARLAALREGLSTGAIVQLDQTDLERYNQQQIAQCSRFVYSPFDDFEDARRLLAAQLEVRSVLSSFKLGGMGEGPGPRLAMPAGSWLVLFGQAEGHMLEIFGVQDGYPMEVSVRSREALANALRDGPFTEMRYYVDRQEVRGMRHVKLVVLEDGSQPRVQICHIDQSLDALMKTVEGRKRT
jgi:hypothetical protein